MKANGQAVPVQGAASTAYINRDTNELYLTLNTTNGTPVIFDLWEFKQAPGRFAFHDARSPSGLLYKHVVHGQLTPFTTRACGSTPTWALEITAYDPAQQTIAGTFRGTVCSDPGQRVALTEGRFHRPFTLSP
ncbi:hypothetical protein GCM10011375_38690 [Hymenobacter qilianensis]|uniref:Uncharacterized protein n=2 Tax=Hymenobacter qilianensis TaxID=1385715 RepID=A0ACB5PWY8_9BACT|nr:hypothetical protein [Hymenobacter qilianensis]QNP54273.1 hypothetical protein H9L05_21620 [Hymenobacter qilianensis]GGF79914.1 hypothetical protein GCM10011375_38690 [Hymenobacter qilianensis]